MLLAATVLTSVGTSAHHGESQGHMPPSAKNMELVGRVELTQVDAGVGDVAALGQHAYVAAWAAECSIAGAETTGGGVHVVDLTLPQVPLKVGFIPAGSNDYVGEGVHAMHLNTSKFTGDVLLFSTEACDPSRGFNGGIQLWDVTDPANAKRLAAGAGDSRPRGRGFAHASHSARMWQAGRKAYAVLVDNDESGFGDIDILDITDPRQPRHIAETGLSDWPRANQRNSSAFGTFPSSYHHDMWVRRIDGHWYLLVSYWDTGWVLLNVDDPRRPRFVRDSDYPGRDALTGKAPEGNAHQATWSGDGRWILAANEAFWTKYTYLRAGSDGRFMRSAELPWAKPVASAFGGSFAGATIYGGLACAPLSVPPASQVQRKPWEQPTVVMIEGVCSPSEKIAAAQRAGYKAAIIAAAHETSMFGQEPARFECTPAKDQFTPSIPVLCLGHSDFHTLFRSKASYIEPVLGEPKVGTRGLRFDTVMYFDGSWGDLQLLNARTLAQVDTITIPQALKPRYAEGYGWLTVHEVKVDPRSAVPLAYTSWYSAGARVVRYGASGLKEVGHYIADGGVDFWGTFPIAQPGARPLLLFSDRDYGLYVLRYTGPE